MNKKIKYLLSYLLTIVCLITTLNFPVAADENESDGYLIPDYENATQIVYDDGSVEGTIPLIYEPNDVDDRNITMPDGSQYRYTYMSVGHCWWYEFVIVGGFDYYSGSIVLSKLYSTNPMPKSVYCHGRSDTVYLPGNTKLCGYSLNQTGIVYGSNGKEYTIPKLNIPV